MKDFVKPGKVNIIIDGQFGDAGKGTIASRIAEDNHIDITAASISSNIDHAFYKDTNKYVTNIFPVAGLLKKRSQIYFSAESVIDPEILFNEIEKFNIDEDRICIHPNATIISKADKKNEKKLLKSISSVMSGTGLARTNKILRKPDAIAKNNDKLKPFCYKLDLHFYLDQGCSMLIESGQGIGLGLNHGYAYPYCTSRDVLPANLLSDFGIHPSYLGNVILLFRTFPIRVANEVENGKEVGYSGPFYDDSTEICWNDIKQMEERDTHKHLTKRIATFSYKQFKETYDLVKPTHVFLNFVNHLTEEYLHKFRWVRKLVEQNIKVYMGYGPHSDNICKYEKNFLNMIIGQN